MQIDLNTPEAEAAFLAYQDEIVDADRNYLNPPLGLDPAHAIESRKARILSARADLLTALGVVA